jgi:hypothetical protein
VRPEVVVELSVDLALEGLRWRHPVRFVRVRAELAVADLAGEMQVAEASRSSVWSRAEVVPELVELEVAVPHLKPASR